MLIKTDVYENSPYFQLSRSQSDQMETSDLKLRKQTVAGGGGAADQTSCGYLVDTEWPPHHQYDQSPARPKSALDGARSL